MSHNKNQTEAQRAKIDALKDMKADGLTVSPLEVLKPETVKPDTVKAETVKAETVKAETSEILACKVLARDGKTGLNTNIEIFSILNKSLFFLSNWGGKINPFPNDGKSYTTVNPNTLYAYLAQEKIFGTRAIRHSRKIDNAPTCGVIIREIEKA